MRVCKTKHLSLRLAVWKSFFARMHLDSWKMWQTDSALTEAADVVNPPKAPHCQILIKPRITALRNSLETHTASCCLNTNCSLDLKTNKLKIMLFFIFVIALYDCLQNHGSICVDIWEYVFQTDMFVILDLSLSVSAALQRTCTDSNNNLNPSQFPWETRCHFSVNLLFSWHLQISARQGAHISLLLCTWPYLGKPLKVHCAHVQLRFCIHTLQCHILAFQNRLRWTFYLQRSWKSNNNNNNKTIFNFYRVKQQLDPYGILNNRNLILMQF